MPPDEQQERVRASFAKQGLMTTLGATLDSVSPGLVEIIVNPHPAILQQHGFVHGGVVSAIADSAAGYAALSLMPADTGIYHRIQDQFSCSGRRRAHPCAWTRCQSWAYPHSGPSGGVCQNWRTREAGRSAHGHANGCEGARRDKRLSERRKCAGSQLTC